MAKATSFSEKVAKQKAKAQEHSIVIKLVESKKSPKGNGWRFAERFVKLASLDDLDKVLK